MKNSAAGLYKLDFDEAREIAVKVNFDVMLYAEKLRSCGPGCDYFSKEKKYYITMLLKHIRGRMQEQTLSPEVHAWLERAAAAEEESRTIDKAWLQIRLGQKVPGSA